MNNVCIRPVTLNDAHALCAIFNYYVDHSVATFETRPFTVEKMRDRIEEITTKYPYFVACEDEKILGYTYLNEFRHYSAYDVTAELAIFIHVDACKKGVGSQLLATLVEAAKKQGFHSVIAAITSSNIASLTLHTKAGFVEVGKIPEVGFKHNAYQAVTFMQKILN